MQFLFVVLCPLLSHLDGLLDLHYIYIFCTSITVKGKELIIIIELRQMSKYLSTVVYIYYSKRCIVL